MHVLWVLILSVQLCAPAFTHQPLRRAAVRPLYLYATAPRTDIYGRPMTPSPSGVVYDAELDDNDDDVSSGPEPIFKVYSVHSAPNTHMPWTAKTQEESTGSGFAISHEDRLCVLTNAHVVSDASYIELRKAGDAAKYVATRIKTSHECDLALLSVDDPKVKLLAPTTQRVHADHPLERACSRRPKPPL